MKMAEVNDFDDGFFIDFDEEEEEFRSCFAEEDEWRDLEESVEDGSKDEVDEFTLKMFFKGVSIAQDGDPGQRASGIGVVMERLRQGAVHYVQKKLDFYVEESVAEHLALMDGLLEALRSDVTRVFAFTDSETVYSQIARGERLENQLLTALAQRILEHASKLEIFVLKLVPSGELLKPLRLAQDAIGAGDGSFGDCPICREEKAPSQLIRLNCSHKFCWHCMIKYMDAKLHSSQVPIRCPQLRCRHCISAIECKSFLPAACYESFQRALSEADILDSEKIYCPYPNCSVLLNPRDCLSTQASSSSQSETSCVDCPECRRFICISCGVPWHSSMSCEEYQELPVEERDAGDITLHRLAQNQRWRRCQQCRRMIELTHGCYHMTCWCGHEFCYSCGAEYHDGQQTCQCAFWDEDFEGSTTPSLHEESEPWRWDSFDSVPMAMDAYTDQERSQLALIQRFLAGGFSLSDLHVDQSPPRCSDSYVDTIKDLHQLPWLERFVSVISDNYYEDYVQ
ncbi:E3 ubiquitin-protein ligase RSL1 [Magnolia sinica]|uniref:E3 ubiquitin-protein ligase RSL1 n=1 Tax=Magnolia sinica TaxID=86752 RepID=UPI00265A68F0|nr:E3 ubiquitin-protein ligase RSL1 [Magnolia sinica]